MADYAGLDRALIVKAVPSSVALGMAAFAVFAILGLLNAGEGLAWIAWLASTATSAFIVGRRYPCGWFQGGLIMMATQPLCVLAVSVMSGEAFSPRSSTGGLVAVFICSILILMWSPIPLLLAWLGALARHGEQEPGDSS